jgi:hypothetical protein
VDVVDLLALPTGLLSHNSPTSPNGSVWLRAIATMAGSSRAC